MKRSKVLKLMAPIMVIILVMTACGAKKSSYDQNATSSSPNATASDAGSDYENAKQDYGTVAEEAEAPKENTTSTALSGEGATSTSSGNSAAQSNEKIIRTFFMEVETQGFDALILRINSDINRMGGYVENSKISGRSFSYSDESRYGNIVARVPREKVDEFVNSVGENANVVSKQESTENVSLQYIETESKIETLKIEQERLYALLEKEDSLDDIIVLENRLSDIRFELQNHESQLRYFDNKVAYSTVTLSIQEVQKLTPVSSVKESMGSRIKNGLGNTMFNLSQGFQNFLVWLIVNLPYLLIWAVVILIAVIITRKGIKKYNAKNNGAPKPMAIDHLKSDWDSQHEEK